IAKGDFSPSGGRIEVAEGTRRALRAFLFESAAAQSAACGRPREAAGERSTRCAAPQLLYAATHCYCIFHVDGVAALAVGRFMEANMQVQEIMSHDVELIDPNSTIRDAACKLRAEDIGALPVGENDRLIGMITDRDMVIRCVADDRQPSKCLVRDAMSKKICYC